MQGIERAASALALLALVACQDAEPAESPDGTDGRWRITRKVAGDRVISTVDPEARHTRKSPEGRRDGYRAHVAAGLETGIITDEKLTKAVGQENSDPAVAEQFLAAETAGQHGEHARHATGSHGGDNTGHDDSAAGDDVKDRLSRYGGTAYGTGDLRGCSTPVPPRVCFPPAGGAGWRSWSVVCSTAGFSPTPGRGRGTTMPPRSRNCWTVPGPFGPSAPGMACRSAPPRCGFVLRHPAVTAALVGARSPGESTEDVSYLDTHVPEELFHELVDRGLVAASSDIGADAVAMARSEEVGAVDELAMESSVLDGPPPADPTVGEARPVGGGTRPAHGPETPR